MNGRPRNININAVLLRQIIEKSPLNEAQISKFILNRERSYIRQCINTGKMNGESLKTLCEFLQIKMADVINCEVNNESNEEDNKDNESFILPTLAQIHNNQMTLVSEVKVLQAQNKELITTIKSLVTVINNINSNLTTNTEKVKAIFTDVHYNK